MTRADARNALLRQRHFGNATAIRQQHAPVAEVEVQPELALPALAIGGGDLQKEPVSDVRGDARFPHIGQCAAGAVSFAKGCYLGQEVVARAEHRGQVKQTLRCYRHDGDAPPIGADVHDHGRRIGVVAATGAGRVLAVTRTGASPVTAAGRSIALAEE